MASNLNCLGAAGSYRRGRRSGYEIQRFFLTVHLNHCIQDTPKLNNALFASPLHCTERTNLHAYCSRVRASLWFLRTTSYNVLTEHVANHKCLLLFQTDTGGKSEKLAMSLFKTPDNGAYFQTVSRGKTVVQCYECLSTVTNDKKNVERA